MRGGLVQMRRSGALTGQWSARRAEDRQLGMPYPGRHSSAGQRSEHMEAVQGRKQVLAGLPQRRLMRLAIAQ
ncbi:hypothetical protein, partial [Xanthomonas citri]|uniref:hypothetical protein n=1 Tax=Xanthomonas citri TaxID=346 RepID=UPI001C1F7077